jgi:hypothetical protein
MTRYSHMFGPKPKPAQQQNLMISTSKHLYLTKAGLLKYQQKEIDHRLAGTKTLLVRLVLLDVETCVIYGEVRPSDEDIDLLGFLARAWSVKPNHPMQGFPKQLNLPKVALTESALTQDIDLLASWSRCALGKIPSGFAAGIHAVKSYEKHLKDLLCMGAEIDTSIINSLSASISFLASPDWAQRSFNDWKEVPAPSASFTQMIDDQYDPAGAWRLDEFAKIFQSRR